jgi:hypothetical protein
MAMHFEDLDATTRAFMLEEFEAEQRGEAPWRSVELTPVGQEAYVEQLREAIRGGDEEGLCVSLARAPYWNQMETYTRNGVTRERMINVRQAAERLAMTEFNTWYVRGLARRLLFEGATQCRVIRAAPPRRENGHCGTCLAYEGAVLRVQEVYEGHRARYWPEPGDPAALTIPFHPGCHHTIGRVKPSK